MMNKHFRLTSLLLILGGGIAKKLHSGKLEAET